MKKLLFTTLALLCAVVVMAVPAKKGLWKTVRLADGTEVRVQLKGDEFAHYWAAEDGTAYVKASSGELYERADVAALVEQTAPLRMAAAQTQLERAAQTTPATRTTVGGSHDPYVGSKKCLVILVNFTDIKFEDGHDQEYYYRMCNEKNFTDTSGNTQSVRDFFLAQSYDQLDIEFDVIGPIELSYAHDYYGGSAMTYPYLMIKEGVKGAYNLGVDFSQYDWDGDKIVDQVFVIYAGHGSASWDDDTLIWPHMSSFTDFGVSALYYNGIKVNTYACSNELSGNAESGQADGIGAMCHEFSHCMGLADMYDLFGENYGMTYWDVMDAGCYNGDFSGYLPAGYTSYERMYCGWLTPIELTEECEVTGMKGLTEGGEAYIIYNKANANEYYMLENRTQKGFDAELFGEGLLIVHVDFDSKIWKYNYVNTTYYSSMNDHLRCTPIAADNTYSEASKSAIAGDVWPNAGNTRLNNNSTPAATTYNANSDGSYFMNVTVAKITKSSDDSSISFTFYPDGTVSNVGNKPEGAVFYESFDDCAGVGGNDGTFDGSGSVALMADNDGWTYNTAYAGSACARFGTSSKAGYVITPTFTITEETEFSFLAAPIKANVAGTLSITCETGNVTLSETTATIAQGEWTEVKIILTGEGDVQLRIQESLGLKRFYLDEVAAVPTSLAGIKTVTIDTTATARPGVYSLSGIYLGTSAANLPKGIYIVDGVKTVVK